MKINVVGLGKLGLPLAVLLSEKNTVTGIDLSSETVKLLQDGIMPFFEPELEERFSTALLKFSDSFDEAGEGEATFIIVPTPSLADGSFSTAFLADAASRLGYALKGRTNPHLVVVVSTVMPGDTETVVQNVLESASGREVGSTLMLTYSPEFIALGEVFKGMEEPDMVLIGQSDERSGLLTQGILQSFLKSRPQIHRMSLIEAEITKIAVNTFVTTKISYANYLNEVCTEVGASAAKVAAAVGADTRIGKKYFAPGAPFGGPCVPTGTKVATFCGFKPIETLVAGDLVLTHDGFWKPIIEVMQRQYDGELIQVNVGGCAGLPMRLTPEHPIYGSPRLGTNGIATYETTVRGERKHRLKRFKVDESNLDFRPAEEYLHGDLILSPKPVETDDETVLLQMPPRQKIGRPSILSDCFVLDEDFARFIGYYLAEGSTWKKEIKFSLHEKEDTIASDIISLGYRLFGLKGNLKRGTGLGVSVQFNCSRLAEWLRATFGKDVYTKKAPFEWVSLNEKLLIQIIRGMWYGDGSNSTDVFTWATVSYELSTFCRYVLLRLGIGHTWRKAPEWTGADGVKHAKAYYIKVANPRYMELMNNVVPDLEIDVTNRDIRRRSTFVVDEGQLNVIKKISRVSYEGIVWNLAVKDSESYVLEAGAVHNCFPRDARAFATFSENLGISADIPLATAAVNERQVDRMVDLVKKVLPPNGKVAILGLAYKPGTWVTEESAGRKLAEDLLDLGMNVVAFDPMATVDDIPSADSMLEATKDADVVVIATAWPEFRNFSLYTSGGYLVKWA